MSLSAFKKGPDYIDSAWLSLVAQADCRNLDTYLVDSDLVIRTFAQGSKRSDIAIIEGNRGLFDGQDSSGTHSTASLAKLLKAPVILVVNTQKATRTIAALIRGCVSFDPDVMIAGVILNRVAGLRHEKVITDSIKRYCGLPVLGAVPNLGDDAHLIPGRRLGLVTPSEYEQKRALEMKLSDIAGDFLDIEGLLAVARTARPLRTDAPLGERVPESASGAGVRVGYFRDTVFTFYYPENLEALEAAGARLVPVSSLDDRSLPRVDALYIGGGFPETHAERLVQNSTMLQSVKKAADDSMPVYAECGGLIYLSESVRRHETCFDMAAVFPLKLQMLDKPVGHGYSVVTVDRPNPFFDVGQQIKGHEFHYSGPSTGVQHLDSCLQVEKGVGIGDNRDGLLYHNTFASYTHIHATGVVDWAPNLVKAAADYRRSRENNHLAH